MKSRLVVEILFSATLSLSFIEAARGQNFAFDHVTVMDGLSHANVTAILQDKTGFMWFGTTYGLNRYDGYSLKFYPFGSITALCEDAAGHLWIGNSAGSAARCLDPATDSVTLYDHDPQNPRSVSWYAVRGIYRDTDESLWMGTDKGLDHFDPVTREFTRYGGTTIPPLPVLSLADDHVGSLWLAMRVGLYRFTKTGHRATRFEMSTSVSDVAVSSSMDGTVWIAGGAKGLLRFSRGAQAPDPVLDLGTRLNARSVLADRNGKVWVGTTTDGLKLFDPATGEWMTFRHESSDPKSLSSNWVNTIASDRAGNIWIGTSAGVNVLARWREPFHHIRHNTDVPNSPPQEAILSACEDRDGDLWIGAGGGGLKRWDRKNGTYTRYLSPSLWVTDLVADRSGSIWIGTTDGLFELGRRTGAVTKYLHDPRDPRTLVSDDVRSLHQDPDGTLWVGTSRFTVSRYDRRRRVFAHFVVDTPSVDSRQFPITERIRSIYRDRSDRLWVIQQDNNLVHLDDKTGAVRRYVRRKTEPFWLKSVRTVYEDSKGRFWIGTDLGVDLLDRQSGEFTAVARGVSRTSGYTCTGILEDDHGTLWFATSSYLFRYQPETTSLRRFGLEDGFPRASSHLLESHAFLKTRSGEIVCGTGDGFVIFHPDSLKDDPDAPTPVFTDFQIFGESVSVGPDSPLRKTMTHTSAIVLPYDQNSIGFGYAELNFTAPSRNVYSHMLEGVDRKWSTPSRQHYAQYTNLAPGEYLFRVRAANSDGVWAENDRTIAVTIVPAYWQTWWLKLLAAVFAIAAVVLLVRSFYMRKLRLERLRVGIAADLHDEVGSNLSGIALLAELVRDTLPTSRPERGDLEKIERSARQTADSLRDIVWIVNPRHDHFDNLVERMKETAQALLGTIPFTFAATADDLGTTLDMTFRRHLLFAYKEMLHNIAKHSRARTVKVELLRNGTVLTLRVTDDGVGFCQFNQNGGTGIDSMRRRAALMKGKVEILGKPGAGTAVELTAKIP